MAQYYSGMPAVNESEIFVPGVPGGFFSSVIVRTDGSAQGRLAMVPDAIRSVDRTVPVFGAKTMRGAIERRVGAPKVLSQCNSFV